MFIGHSAVGFAAKRFAPRASLAVLLAAPLLADLLWPPFLLLGWERVRIDPSNTKFTPLDLAYYPWSHSLLLCLVWATGFALLYDRITHYRRGTLAVWVGVVSHWILDGLPIAPICLSIQGDRAWAWVSGTPSPARWSVSLSCSGRESGFMRSPHTPGTVLGTMHFLVTSSCC